MQKFDRYMCIHGHFYQPPRENPWLEQIEIQQSAQPFHDWNERVSHECYGPNTRARILDEKGLLTNILNNFLYISFDFGPTLLSWLEQHAKDVYEAVLAADAESVTQRSGHGNAAAQAFNHMIMPLASSRDKRTQVTWGIKDFKRRFKRDPEGMWLPETAVDRETLEIMVDEGIKFTILAQKQALRFRETASTEWVDANSSAIDPSRPYICRLSKDRSIVLFFYDGPISQAIAFEGLLHNGAEFKNRLLAAFSPNRAWNQLVHIATDGEWYGHHHRFGEMALAYALEGLISDSTLKLTNYGEYLALNPPSAEAEYHENSAWSCAHGVGRWSLDCGCSVSQQPGWNQKWRAPLRKALDVLRDKADDLFVEKTASYLKDPWAARDDYISLVLQVPRKIGPFMKQHQGRVMKKSERETVLKMLEMQRSRMLMYTSCGWFFDDISGLESMQILRYAARVLQIAYPYEPDLIEKFLKELDNASSNLNPPVTGADLFQEKIMPQVAGLERVAAHVAISYIFGRKCRPNKNFIATPLKLLTPPGNAPETRRCLSGE